MTVLVVEGMYAKRIQLWGGARKASGGILCTAGGKPLFTFVVEGLQYTPPISSPEATPPRATVPSFFFRSECVLVGFARIGF